MNDTQRRRSRRARNVAQGPSGRWAAAVRHLRRVDPQLRAIIDRVGPCRLEPHPDRFGALVRSIISQQISSKAAASINRRLVALGGEPHQPARLIELGEASLRTVGLSSAKARYVLNLAEAVASGQVPLDDFDDSWDDQAITQALTAVKGIGVWTAEMFLIFALNRRDILPASDLGVRVALRDRHGLDELPRPRDCHALAESWRPYRTIASWYIWKGTDTPIASPETPAAEAGRPRNRSRTGEST
ncbi:MAG: DNA-3-methyladenine glycosylase family protein [Isosphaerales bacterium]